MLTTTTKKNIIQVGGYILFMWIVFIVTSFVPSLKGFGIVPRQTIGLIGVLTAPFLHGDLNHIIGNTVALITFTPIFILIVGKNAIEKLISLTFATGLLTWGLAFPGNHIGASGVVFALYGYLISLGFIHKNFKYMALSAFLLIGYGYMIIGVFPLQAGISWESHLCGFVVGAGLAKVRP